MNPSLIVGIGGTGKWVITYLKKLILDKNGGKIPDEIDYISFDLTADEEPKVEIPNYNFVNGKLEVQKLDFEPTSKEFHDFSSNLTENIQKIKEGEYQDESILSWFNKSDAEYFEGQISSKEGAGQIRALSRLSYFFDINDIISKLYDKIHNLAALANSKNQTLYIFVVSSIAGGTGCGTLIDFTLLIYHLLRTTGFNNLSYHTIGFIVLPTAFKGIKRRDEDMKTFKANCYSAFREIHRYMTFLDHEIKYGNIKLEIKNQHLFDFLYFVDGSSIIGDKGEIVRHYEGVCPSISELIYLYLGNYIQTTTSPNVLLDKIRPQIIEFKGRVDIPIYFTFGLHKYIFELEDIKLSFAHKLSKEILYYFIDKEVYVSSSDVQSFFINVSLPFFHRNFLYKIIEQPGSVPLKLNSLLNYIKFNDTSLDLPRFPEMKIDDIDYGSIIKRTPFIEIQRKIDSRYDLLMGKEDDLSNPKGGSLTTYGYLNYYRDKHIEMFSIALKNYLLDILNREERKGCLVYTLYFLDELIKTYNKILESFNDQIMVLDIEAQISKYNKQNSDFKKRQKSQSYVETKKRLFDLTQHQKTILKINETINGYIKVIEDIKNQINNWKETFSKGRDKIIESEEELIRYRISKRRVKIWSFVTEPNDKIEERLYDLIKKESTPLNDIEKIIKDNNKLPQIVFKDLINSMNGYFKWKFDGDKLNCYLPSEFSPSLSELENEPIKWNYNFVNNYLELGSLSSLNGLNIFDIFKLKNINLDDINNNLNSKSNVMLILNESVRPNINSNNLRSIEKIVYNLSSFSISEPGKELADKFLEKNRDKNNQDKPEFSNELIQYKIYNYIPYINIVNIVESYDVYRELNKNKHLHIFMEEKNVSILEEDYKNYFRNYPGEDYGLINYKIVDSFIDIETFIKLTYAILLKWIKYDPAKNNYYFDFKDKLTEQIEIGNNFIEILQFLKNGELKDKFKDFLDKNYSEFVSKLNDKDKIEEHLGNLTKYLTDIDNELKNKEKLVEEKDLLKLMKCIIYKEIEKYEDIKRRII